MALDLLSVCRWLALPPNELLDACRQTRYQGSGPGGQKRNRVYSGVRLIHPESGISIEADAHRESRRNLEDALHRLRLELALSVVSASRLRNAEGGADVAAGAEASMAFRATAFRANASPAHDDFALFALRAVYFLNQHQGRASAAAQALGCTASALTRFLKTDKTLWVKAKEIREAHGLHPLK